ncbi:retinol dehydrogenase 8-like [Xenia sp. Carnegie-2017]|uniref:retinol dehydrogenase 8-like n=1 Tax=Xenia sp. Carnegie-2017 TaxID=2897299 RepID=UPI001F03AFF6|nr:retinol dehydrogenase 8-like [Xenia sp. Carnegie-2017]
MVQEIVLITGTSHGLGLSTAEMLAMQANKKFKVYASMRNINKRGELEKKIAGCSNAVIIELDVCSEDSVNSAVKHILQKEGKIDIVDMISTMNNAAISWCGAIEVQPWDTITSLYDTNVFGPLRVPFVTVYASSKYALEGISDSLAPELATFNVQ